ncbi:hypothetical protein [Xanthobacter autotrophicus]|uniref:hypothetical protein n=1 Tax=Xanthobacter autotrophicus TaxID=280 RepID=UPI0024A78876|nr:hypothetical protein [Xanthobacter autotrophicus]MDI4655082.1 hypothetical protein [Xanthobacter autotrophicus]
MQIRTIEVWRPAPQLKAHFTEPQIVELTWPTALCGAFNRCNGIVQVDVET